MWETHITYRARESGKTSPNFCAATRSRRGKNISEISKFRACCWRCIAAVSLWWFPGAPPHQSIAHGGRTQPSNSQHRQKHRLWAKAAQNNTVRPNRCCDVPIKSKRCSQHYGQDKTLPCFQKGYCRLFLFLHFPSSTGKNDASKPQEPTESIREWQGT
jgi:hypothetical protein